MILIKGKNLTPNLPKMIFVVVVLAVTVGVVVLLSSQRETPSEELTPVPISEKKDSQLKEEPKSKSLHSCSITPFAQTIKKGQQVNYLISLTPSIPNSPFELSLGSLPLGVSAVLGQTTGLAPSEITLRFDTQPDAQKGSFSLVVIYQEQQKDDTLLSSFCQLNLIIE